MAQPTTTDLQQLAINTIRTLAIDAVQSAESGHPGLPMGAAPMAYTLFTRHLRINPTDPHWFNRDRFVLSAGHGSMLQYALLHLAGYDLSLDDLRAFRQWESRTPGHPEYFHTPGVEVTTGPLGQGIATAVGIALAEAFLARTHNTDAHTIVDHHTYVIASDGDMMEGVCAEACALAGHWGLGKLIVLYDSNRVTLDGDAAMTFTENIPLRFEAQGWHVVVVSDGNDVDAIDAALAEAKAMRDQPSLVVVRTVIGYGSPQYAGTSEAHGKALGTDEVAATKRAYGWAYTEPFTVPDGVYDHFAAAAGRGQQAQQAWQATLDAWRAAQPDGGAAWDRVQQRELTPGWDADLPSFPTDKPVATRNASGKVLNAIARHIPTMIGGDADLAGSTKTLIDGARNTGPGQPAARNVRFGVREHGMGAIVNGLALHGGVVKPYSATFLTFSDYMRPAVRMGALMQLPTIYVFTHDSIGLGEDGPTHQPVEHVMSLRAMPVLHVFRPADAHETVAAWRSAMTLEGPCALIFTRQNVPVLAGDHVLAGAARGGYVLADADNSDPEVLLLASGSEVHIAHEAWAMLRERGVRARVVSLPCWELFEAQDDAYRASVIPPTVRARVSIEAGTTLGWQRYVGLDGTAIGVDRFGASAPYQRIYDELGLTPEAVAQAALGQLGR